MEAAEAEMVGPASVAAAEAEAEEAEVEVGREHRAPTRRRDQYK